MQNNRLNDEDRRQWVENHEELYNLWLRSVCSIQKFIKNNRAEIDKTILRELNRPPLR